MGERVLPIKPGIYSEGTDTTSVNRWVRGNLVRFLNGLPQKIGGWTRSSIEQASGIPRTGRDWAALDGTQVMAVGTHLGIYSILGNGTTWTNITPTREASTGFNDGTESDLSNPFATTNGSNTVAVDHTAHGVELEACVEFTGAVAVGGVPAGDLNTQHYVTSVIDPDTYTIEVATSATVDVAAGGGTAVEYRYRLNPGRASSQKGKGWGVGGYGEGGWGTARASASSEDLVTLPAAVWSFDLWGEDLVAARPGTGIYTWSPSVNPSYPAAPLANAPTQTQYILVASTGQHIIALGAASHLGGAYDPLIVRWCSSRARTDWTPAIENSSGEDRVSAGNSFVSGLNVGNSMILLFTDTFMFRMNYLGAGLTYGIQPVGVTSIMGSNAGVEFGGVGYWMDERNFYTYAGRMQVIPCDVQTYVFNDFNRLQAAKVFAGICSEYREVLWFYPSASSTEVDRVVAYDTLQRTWWTGELSRSLWFDGSLRYTTPWGFSPSGDHYLHESGSSADGSPMSEYLESFAASQLNNPGEESSEVMRVTCYVPDFAIQEQALEYTLRGRKRPNAREYTSGPHTVQPTDLRKCYTLRARQIQVKIAGGSYTGHWRAGPIVIDAKPDGLI